MAHFQWLREKGALDRIADALQDHWDQAMQPYWPGMRAALEEEVLNPARSLASAGPDQLLARLHDRVRWGTPGAEPGQAGGSGFPLIFSRGALMCASDRGEVIGVEPAGLAMVSLIGSQHSAQPELISRALA